ncbi:MAG: hypothetical protein CVV42_01060 [Candidatus Riflebacteria bacterium HGW-Riflebacteria-2]|jgi:hypothetical protein|nr:MAG: hypothetical protein CVV42_01060 [Candidatus Riflebacteria bacterium HGW-Riflebacteria-2]
MVKRSSIIGLVLMTTCFLSFPVFAQSRGAPSRTDPARDSGRHNPTISEPVGVTPAKTEATDEYLKEEFGALVKFDRVREEIATQISRKSFSEADFLITTLKADIKNSILSATQKNKLLAEIERNESVEFFSLQGEYRLAANAIIRAMKLNKDPADFDNLKAMFEKISAQRKVFEIKIAIEKQAKKFAETKRALLKEKLAILKKMNTGKKLADKELKRLQASLKTIDEKLRSLENEVRVTQRSYMPEIGLKLGKEFDREVSICLESRLAVERDNQELEKQIVKHLTEIGESSEITWKNLREDIIELGNLLNITFRLRARLEILAKKASSLTDSELSEVSEIKAQLEKAIQNREDKLNAIENAFINQEIFEKLTGSEIKELFSRMRGFWIKQRVFDSLEPSLKELYEAFIIENSPVEQPDAPASGTTDIADANIQGTGRIIQHSEGFMLIFRGDVLKPNNLPVKYKTNDLEVAFAANYVHNRKAYIEKYPEINLVFINAKSDDYIMRPGERVEPRIGPDGVIIPGWEVRPIQIRKQDQGQDQDRPANLMNSF